MSKNKILLNYDEMEQLSSKCFYELLKISFNDKDAQKRCLLKHTEEIQARLIGNIKSFVENNEDSEIKEILLQILREKMKT